MTYCRAAALSAGFTPAQIRSMTVRDTELIAVYQLTHLGL